MYKKISDYGIIGNLRTIALIGLDGSVDWMCMPHIDSPSVFGALLDDRKGGRFSIAPADEWDSAAEYIPGTNILKTKFRTRTGIMELVDFMPVCENRGNGIDEERHELYRYIFVPEGTIRAAIVFDPRFDYARGGTELENIENGVIAHGNGESMVLSCSHDMSLTNGKPGTEPELKQGDSMWMKISYGDHTCAALDKAAAEKELNDTEAYWKNWLNRSETGRVYDPGPFRDMVERSALVLKLLYYEPAGTIAAAATTSLPEVIGGERNWDYRYTWIRDTSFTLQALFNLGHLTESEGFIKWIEKLLSGAGAGHMQIMYGLRGEKDIPEYELGHLDGYKGSRPVRTGNGAAAQKQLDIYGELMDAALKLSDYAGKIDIKTWPFLCGICDYVVDHWRDKDSGIWEIRGGQFEFVYSKVMCWVALDRGITIAKRYGFPADPDRWRYTADEIKRGVLAKGWNKEKKAFVQHYDTDALDSSSLLIPVLGFLPNNDEKVLSNAEAVQRELGTEDFLYRYAGDDGLSGKEGTFLLCTFWFIDNLIAFGKTDEADALIRRTERAANHLGLFSEEYDTHWRESLGNFPQAFTHIGYINSVIALQQAKQKSMEPEKVMDIKTGILCAGKVVLNQGTPGYDIPVSEIAVKLKNSMNIMRGAFFDAAQGRVAYEKMRNSKTYEEYLELSCVLKNMNLRELKNDREKAAFWINLYNVIVIHGVIALGIRDSVKEVRNIFKRIQYRIGDMCFSPEDIEHGILRCNRRPPHSLFRVFGKNDRRNEYSLRDHDPRIHFALVCASSSCPPIDVYTADKLDEELDISGRTFLNGGGIKVDRNDNSVYLSQIFKWYKKDFGRSREEIIKFIAPYLYDVDAGRYLHQNADKVKLDFQDYDWRLNRS